MSSPAPGSRPLLPLSEEPRARSSTPPDGSAGRRDTVTVTFPPASDGPARRRLLEDTSEKRKQYPVTSGLLDYFPDACAAVAEVSYLGNEKHNPGEPLHWARGKSMDHADCIARHLIERGGFDFVLIRGVQHRIRHSAALAWRAMANLQEELEAEYKLATPRGARDAA